MDDKELIARLTEASWSLDYPEDLIAVRAAARLTALAEENERMRVERLRVCIPSTTQPGDRFVCEAYGRWSIESIKGVESELNDPEFDIESIATDDEFCAWITARWIEGEYDGEGRCMTPGYWEIAALSEVPR